LKIVTVDQMREIERRAAAEHGLTTDILMEHAGRSVAEAVRAHLGGDVAGLAALVLVGPGNNGGDGRVAARYLAEWGAQISYYVWKQRRLEVGTRTLDVGDDLAELQALLERTDFVLDALLGTGHARPLDPSMRAVLGAVAEERARRSALFFVAVDLPTGLNADTGEVDPGTCEVDLTVALAFPKLGMLLFPGVSYLGEMEIGSIGLPPGMAEDVSLDLMDVALVRGLLPPRPLNSHKGTFGKAMILAGSMPYPGSAYLATTAAGRVGAGLVTLAVTPAMAPIYAVKLSEATFHILPASDAPPRQRAQSLLDGLGGYASILIGPGLGQAQDTREFLMAVFDGLRALPDDHRPRLVVDADGLNNLARLDRWWERLPHHTVITPHPGEMGRLRGGAHVSGGGSDRLQVAQWAAQWGLVVVLKGGCTLIASPEGSMRVFWPPNPALATAGTGDVLAGTIAGLLAQGMEPFDAASAGVFLHGCAGLAVSERIGDAGLLAGDLLPELPIALRDTRHA
jgi:ADP-dependent NAD(P)H-hydrate dehydratase / NAD(P)H-hydrate epimerase